MNDLESIARTIIELSLIGGLIYTVFIVARLFMTIHTYLETKMRNKK